MAQKDKVNLSMDDLKLVPIDSEEKTPAGKSVKSDSKKAKFTVDKRSYKERREPGDRRATIRFQSERRECIDRRSNTNWDTL